MTHLDLLERIKCLDVRTIEQMSADGMVMLTSQFDESLTRNLIMRGGTNLEQRRTFAAVKKAYKSWKKDTDIMWGAMPMYEVYPEWMNLMQMDIECGYIMTAEGSAPPQRLTVKVSPVLDYSKMIKYTESKITEQTTETETNNKQLEKLQARIAELEAENNSLKERIKELEEKEHNEGPEFEKEELAFLDDWQKLTTREFAIFFSQALGVSFNPKLINQQQLANLAAKWTEPKPDTIRTKIGNLFQEETKVSNEQLDGFSQKTKDEAMNVYMYILKVAKYYSSITPKMHTMLDNIEQIYGLNIDEERKKKIFETIEKERNSGK